MVPWPNLLAFALASIALIALPGPSVLFVIGRTLTLGRTGGLLSVLGNSLGALPALVLVALGVGTIVAQSATLFTVIKFAGAGYLVYLGVQAIRHRKDAAGSASAEETPSGITPSEAPQSRGARFGRAFRHPTTRILGEAFLVGLTNPKTIVFFVAVLPQFVDYGAGMIPLQLAELGLVFIALALIGDSLWALTAGAARDWFAQSPKRLERLAGAGGAMMIGLGGVLALTGNKS
ncbi:LysE family translocator [Microterricola viridarii]|uniref:Threonine/homoserine/homoserine lactone efflux protein n=1 Tax=Microterricola viridarii TaxID=412690 RepID=A0A1H1LMF6_9MICO|nr:LysE family translocator [Microterricola viridarii]SDR75530.1 Threonine/homoserine/homoserine lactone efflux protein [Microterricola viridarii]